MNLEEIRSQAMEQLADDYSTLATLPEGEEKVAVVNRVNTLTKLINDQDKTSWEYDAKISVNNSELEVKNRELDIREKEIELREKELDFKKEELKKETEKAENDSKNKLFTAFGPVVLTSFVSLITLGVYCSQSAKWMKFEETGTATSPISKGLIGRLFK